MKYWLWVTASWAVTFCLLMVGIEVALRHRVVQLYGDGMWKQWR